MESLVADYTERYADYIAILETVTERAVPSDARQPPGTAVRPNVSPQKSRRYRWSRKEWPSICAAIRNLAPST